MKKYSNNIKIRYRPEIDSLRAISVLAVIIYHAKINILGYAFLPGGYLGVDIFFVISGYLITSIIFKELNNHNKFSFKNFYLKRARRILPALLFLLFCSIPLAWFSLLPSAFIDFAKSIYFSIGFSSNFYFYLTGLEYGAVSGLLKPLLHTWSLSVEEQFYILFPITIIFIYKFFRKYLLLFLVVFFILSFFMHLTMSKEFPSLTFYFLHTRIWELIAGSILAYLEVKFGCRSRNKVLNSFMPIIGLILISFSILFFDSNIFNPSILILLTIIGTCILIWFSNDNNLVKKILSHKLFVSIGLISYSLYLWHYPIFSFAKSSGIVSGSFEKKRSTE